MIMGPSFPIAVGIPIISALRRSLDLLFRDIGHETAFGRVVMQLAPRNRMMFFTHSEEAAEPHHRISNLAGLFVDHQVID